MAEANAMLLSEVGSWSQGLSACVCVWDRSIQLGEKQLKKTIVTPSFSTMEFDDWHVARQCDWLVFGCVFSSTVCLFLECLTFTRSRIKWIDLTVDLLHSLTIFNNNSTKTQATRVNFQIEMHFWHCQGLIFVFWLCNWTFYIRRLYNSYKLQYKMEVNNCSVNTDGQHCIHSLHFCIVYRAYQ